MKGLYIDKIESLIKGFSTDNPRKCVTFDENNDPDFKQEIYLAHEGKTPNDFIFEKFCESLEALRDYEIEGENHFENVMGEICDGMTSIYTHELREHFAQFSHFADAAKIDNCGPDATIDDCISMGYYMHCYEILTTVWEYVKEYSENELEEQIK